MVVTFRGSVPVCFCRETTAPQPQNKPPALKTGSLCHCF